MFTWLKGNPYQLKRLFIKMTILTLFKHVPKSCSKHDVCFTLHFQWNAIIFFFSDSLRFCRLHTFNFRSFNHQRNISWCWCDHKLKTKQKKRLPKRNAANFSLFWPQLHIEYIPYNHKGPTKGTHTQKTKTKFNLWLNSTFVAFTRILKGKIICE